MLAEQVANSELAGVTLGQLKDGNPAGG